MKTLLSIIVLIIFGIITSCMMKKNSNGDSKEIKTNIDLPPSLAKEYENILNLIKDKSEEEQKQWERFIGGKMNKQEEEKYQIQDMNKLSKFEDDELGNKRKDFLNKYFKLKPKDYSILRKLFSVNELAVLSVRENSIEFLNEGMNILNSNIEEEDERDIIVSLVLFYNSLKELNIDPIIYFKGQQKNMNESMKKMLQSFYERPENINTLQAMAYKKSQDEIYGLVKIPWRELRNKK